LGFRQGSKGSNVIGLKRKGGRFQMHQTSGDSWKKILQKRNASPKRRRFKRGKGPGVFCERTRKKKGPGQPVREENRKNTRTSRSKTTQMENLTR